MGRFLDKAKAAAEQAAAKVKEEAHELQTKRELGQVYDELGRTAFELADAGEISHARLTAHVERIRSLKAQLEAEEASAPLASDSESGAA